MDTNPIILPCSLARAGNKWSLKCPKQCAIHMGDFHSIINECTIINIYVIIIAECHSEYRQTIGSRLLFVLKLAYLIF